MKHGFILVNKPEGPTSHDIVNSLRKITGIRKIGHAGTLDPFAKGFPQLTQNLDILDSLKKR